jgi:hypothetical protein
VVTPEQSIISHRPYLLFIHTSIAVEERPYFPAFIVDEKKFQVSLLLKAKYTFIENAVTKAACQLKGLSRSSKLCCKWQKLNLLGAKNFFQS